MNTCETCIHWDKSEDYKKHHLVGACCAVPMLWDSFGWNDKGERVLLPEFEESLAFVQDGSDYIATLFTKKDFACNQWEG